MKDSQSELSPLGAAIDRRMALAFGVLILFIMLVGGGASFWLFDRLIAQEERRLASALASVLEQSIDKVSFSGKYRTRLLVDEMADKIPEILFISVETSGGRALAHSDEAKNDSFMDGVEAAELRARCLRLKAPVVGEDRFEGRKTLVVAIPCKMGNSENGSAVLRVGLNIDEFRDEAARIFFKIIGLGVFLSCLGIFAVYILSRHFGSGIRGEAKRLREMADSVPGVICQFASDGENPPETIFASRNAKTLLGLGPDSFVTDFIGLLPPKSRARFLDSIAEAARERDSWDCECTLCGDDEKERFFSFSALISREDGRRAVFSGVLMDISARKLSEAALRASEERYSNISNLSPLMIAIVRRKDAKLVDANPAFFAQSGLDKDASSGRPFDELGIFSEPKSLLASLEGVSPESEVRNLEILMTPIGARPRACLLSCASLRQDGVDCWLLLLNDIADRKLAELELRKSRDILLNVMNSIPLAVFWKSPEGRFLGCNDVFAKLAGFDRPNQIIGLSDFELPWRKEESDAYVKDDKAVIERGEGFSHKLETLTRADGSRIWVDTSKMPLLDENGRAYAILGVFEDISERVFAEKEKAKLHAQLDQARKMESVGRLAGGVAHDFNNMLQAITGYVFVLKKRLAADSSALAPLEEIEKAAKRSSALTSQLLAFARRQTVAPKLISINSAIDGMLNMLRRLVGESVSLEWKPGDALKCVKMDPSQLDQVVANLVVNARDAIEGDGRIVMETASFRLEEGADGRHPDCKPGEYVLLKVSDTGKGMSKEVLEHLFEPFFTTKATGKGTGLGLATVFGVVKQNGGSIEVFSEPGKGSVFEILFPALDGAPEDEAKNRPPAPAKGDETILVVEDEEQILSLCEETLSSSGYKVLSAAKPEQALALAAKHDGKIDLLLSDVVMPEMNGKTLRDKLKLLRPGMLCLFMSGHTDDVIACHGVIERDLQFIQKPFEMDELLGKIREVLDSRRA